MLIYLDYYVNCPVMYYYDDKMILRCWDGHVEVTRLSYFSSLKRLREYLAKYSSLDVEVIYDTGDK